MRTIDSCHKIATSAILTRTCRTHASPSVRRLLEHPGQSSLITVYRKASTRKTRLALENREPKIFENPKQRLYMHGTRSSESLRRLFLDLVDSYAMTHTCADYHAERSDHA